MPKDDVQKQDLSYLYAEPDAEAAVLAQPNIPTISMGHKDVRILDGVECVGSKFSCEGFPEQNLTSFIFAPLVVNSQRRVLYLKDYQANNAVPPDCQSIDGIAPATPLTYNGQVHTSCNTCPLFGYSKDFKCRNKGLLAGVAYFPNHNGELILFRKDIPGGSAKALNSLATDLGRSIVVDGERRKIPIKYRWVKASIENRQTNYGLIPSWVFTVLDPDHKEPGYPPFVPPEFAEDLTKMQHAAMSFSRMDTTHVLTTSEPVAALTTQPAQVDASILKAEAEAGY